jgi:hypothetical protein
MIVLPHNLQAATVLCSNAHPSHFYFSSFHYMCINPLAENPWKNWDDIETDLQK